MSHRGMPLAALDPAAAPVLALDGTAIIGTFAFFVPAAILVTLVGLAVWRDRRSVDDDEDASV